MNLLLTRNRFLYASRRILNEASARSIPMQAIDPAQISGPVDPERADVGSVKRALLRFGASSRSESLMAATLLEAQGVDVINDRSSSALASSKTRSALALATKGLPMLESWVVQRFEHLTTALEKLGGYPLVAKSEFGSQGEGVFLLESEASAGPIVARLLKEGPILLQRFIAEADGSDSRYLVLDGKILAGVRRDGSSTGDFRANFHRGAMLTSCMEDESAELSIKAADALGLRFAGVDLIQTRDGTRILEVNASAGFKGVEEACGISVAGAIVEHFCA